MKFRQSVALNVSPVLLRVLVGITFLWAGLGKVIEFAEPNEQQTIDFIAMGVLEPTEPTVVLPPEAEDGVLAESDADEALANELVLGEANTIRVRRVHMISWLVYHNAQPRIDEETGEERAGLLPGFLAQGIWPRFMGWMAAVTEILASIAVLVGLLTRFFAITLAGVISMASWLTAIGPAIQSGNANLGFLPAGSFYDPAVMSGVFWQFALLVACLSLLLTGAGWLSLDHRLFSGPKVVSDEDEDDA